MLVSNPSPPLRRSPTRSVARSARLLPDVRLRTLRADAVYSSLVERKQPVIVNRRSTRDKVDVVSLTSVLITLSDLLYRRQESGYVVFLTARLKYRYHQRGKRVKDWESPSPFSRMCTALEFCKRYFRQMRDINDAKDAGQSDTTS